MGENFVAAVKKLVTAVGKLVAEVEKLVAAAVKKLFRFYDSPFFQNSVDSRLFFFLL